MSSVARRNAQDSPTSFPGSLILPPPETSGDGKMRDPGNEVEDSLICISFGLYRRWPFTNGAREVADLLRRWLVGELAVGV